MGDSLFAGGWRERRVGFFSWGLRCGFGLKGRGGFFFRVPAVARDGEEGGLPLKSLREAFGAASFAVSGRSGGDVTGM